MSKILVSLLILASLISTRPGPAQAEADPAKPSLADRFRKIRKYMEFRCGSTFVTLWGTLFLKSDETLDFEMHNARKNHIRRVISDFDPGDLPTTHIKEPDEPEYILILDDLRQWERLVECLN